MDDDRRGGTVPRHAPHSPHPSSYARDDVRGELQRLVRQLGVESQRVGHVFAQRHGLHPTDLEALVHVMDAELHGDPLTPGRLAARIGLSSGATTAVVDRLVAGDHVVRDRHPDDRRKVVLRHAAHGRDVAFRFFSPLGQVSEAVMDGFTDDELQVARRFLAGMTRAIAEHTGTVATEEIRPSPQDPSSTDPR
ncbi:MAG: MarR family winged helix-turn-helix transcriptional regulator [Kineosporiaceae bacterium]